MRSNLGWIVLVVLLAGLSLLALAFGPAGLTLDSQILASRVPRLLLTIFAGGILALVGAALQGLLQNPLVDPYIIGSSSGAGVGVALSLLLGWTSVIGRPLFAFAGAAGALFLVYTLARMRGRMSRLSLILAGVAVSFVGSSLVMVLMVLSREQLAQIIYFLMGSTKVVFTPTKLWVFAGSAVVSLGAAGWLVARWRSLDILSTNIEAAESLGVDTQKLTTEVFVLSALLVGVVVAFAGAISFIGLVVPHIVRFIFGPRHLRVLPGSFLAGASLLLASDLCLRGFAMATGVDLPLSVVTTLFGVPVFLYIMRRRLA
ncbi:iron ABC transporter permease [candidate division WOR-3 bacterium]|nr:iron ABC transporter permease [candidate division WOR-3 bacterium]